MLVYIPALFFLSLFFLCYKKNGFDVSACMSLLYAITSVASIFLPSIQSEYSYENVSLTPLFFYCLFSGLTIIPFYFFNSNKKRPMMQFRKLKLFNVISYYYIIAFFLSLYFSYSLLMSRLNSTPEELASLRSDLYRGDLEIGGSTGPLHMLEVLVGITSAGAYVMIAFFFYSICFLKKTIWFNVLLIVSSLSNILGSIISVDRSGAFYWAVSFILVFFLFRPYILHRRAKKYITTMTAIIGIVLGGYFLTVSFGRFNTGEGGMEGGIIDYMGQPLYNVCDIWDNLNRNGSDFRGVTPITSLIFESITGSPLQSGLLQSSQRLSYAGFNTTIGYLIREVGIFWMFFFAIVISYAINRVICSYNKKKELYLSDVILIYMVGHVVMCGFISYYYASWPKNLMFLFFLFLGHRLDIYSCKQSTDYGKKV